MFSLEGGGTKLLSLFATASHTHSVATASSLNSSLTLSGGSKGFLSADDKRFIEQAKIFTCVSYFSDWMLTSTSATILYFKGTIAEGWNTGVIHTDYNGLSLPMASSSTAGCITAAQCNIISGYEYTDSVDIEYTSTYSDSKLAWSGTPTYEKIYCTIYDTDVIIFTLVYVVSSCTAYYIGYYNNFTRYKLVLTTAGKFTVSRI